MSLFSYALSDPFDYYPISCYRPRQTAVNPFRQVDRMMGSVLGQLQRVPQNDFDSQVQYNDKGDLTLRCQTSGFKPEELSVDVDGGKLTVHGKHIEEREGESVERHFTRVIRLPKDLDQSKIKCELDDKNELSICIPRYEQVAAPKQSVPIEVKKPQAEQKAPTK